MTEDFRINHYEITQQFQESVPQQLIADLATFIEGMDYLELVSRHGPRSQEVQSFLSQHPRAEVSLDFLRDVIWEGKESGQLRPRTFLWDLGRFVEGFQYWRILEEHGRDSEATELFKLQNPEAEDDLQFFSQLALIFNTDN